MVVSETRPELPRPDGQAAIPPRFVYPIGAIVVLEEGQHPPDRSVKQYKTRISVKFSREGDEGGAWEASGIGGAELMGLSAWVCNHRQAFLSRFGKVGEGKETVVLWERYHPQNSCTILYPTKLRTGGRGLQKPRQD